MRTFKIFSFSNLWIYNTASLTVVTMLYITFSELTYLQIGSWYILTPVTCFTHSSIPHLWQPPIYSWYLSFSFFFIIFFKDSTSKWDNTVMSCSIWLFSLSILPSRSILIVIDGRVSFFFVIFHCVCVYICFLHHSFLDRHFGCFHILAIVNNAAVKHRGWKYVFQLVFSFSSDKYLNHMVVVLFFFWGTSTVFHSGCTNLHSHQ